MTDRITLLLLDVDGVLIYSKGYKEALRLTVTHFAERMGLSDAVQMAPTYDEIALFEACGITSEWDSTPLCVGMLLLAALREHPGALRAGVSATAAALSKHGVSIERPDYRSAAHAVLEATPADTAPTAAIQKMLQARSADEIHPLLAELLDDVYSLASPTTHVFQHYVLGHERFEETFGEAALFAAESTLIAHDRPLIASEMRDRLRKQVASDSLRAAIYTARPTLPPRDLPEESAHSAGRLYPPEGDMAVDLLGLEGTLPLIGGGRITWLAAQHSRHPDDYIKPSPVQALAAMGAALTNTEAAALSAAARFHEASYAPGALSGPLASLRNAEPVQVVVFEDSAGGIRAAQSGCHHLRKAGVDITAVAVGVAEEASKREVLAEVADRVVDNVNVGLSDYLA